jgi:peptidoglycan hydrolase CwlO-like protein
MPEEKKPNIIIRYLQQILTTVIASAIIGLFVWGSTLSKTIEQQDGQMRLLNQRIDDLQKELNGTESDVDDVQKNEERIDDSFSNRLTRLETQNDCKTKK